MSYQDRLAKERLDDLIAVLIDQGDISDPSPEDGLKIYVQERKPQGKVVAERLFGQNTKHAWACFHKLVENPDYRSEFLVKYRAMKE